MNIGIQIKGTTYGVQEEVALYIADLRQQVTMLEKVVLIGEKDVKKADEEVAKMKTLLVAAETAMKAQKSSSKR